MACPNPNPNPNPNRDPDPNPNPTPNKVEYALDVNATLFLNMFDVLVDKDITQLEDGRFMYLPTGTTPCVLHFNGKSKDLLLKTLSMRAAPSAWVTQASVKLNASSCTHRACRGAGACPGGRELVTRPRCAPLGAGPPSSRAAHRRVHAGAHSPRGAGAAQGEEVPLPASAAHEQPVGLGVEPTTLV